MLRLTLALP